MTIQAAALLFLMTANPVPAQSAGLHRAYLIYRNTFYWDKQAMQLYPGDYTKARIFHWLHEADN